MLRGTDAYWAARPDDVAAWIHYRVEYRNGAPTLFITGRCAEFRWPEILEKLEDRMYFANGEVAGLREGNSRLYRDVQGYSTIARQFFQLRLDIYSKAVSIPVFGAKHYWYRFEFAKSRGQIHFRMFAISAGNQPKRLPHAMKNGGAQEKAGALAKWARGRYRSRRCTRPGAQMAGKTSHSSAPPTGNESRQKIETPPAYCSGVRYLFARAVLHALIPTAVIHAATTARDPLDAALKQPSTAACAGNAVWGLGPRRRRGIGIRLVAPTARNLR